MPSRVDVVVFGAGPAGLAAAWELTKEGYRTLVVEMTEAPGGLCRTHEHRGFRLDQGGHRFITRSRELFDRVHGLLGEDLRVRERHSVIQIDGREYRYPLDLVEVLRGEDVIGITRILGSYVLSRATREVSKRLSSAAEPENSLQSWVRARFGGAIFNRFFKDYTEKLWGVGAQDLSGDWAGQRISQIGLGDFIRHALGREQRVPRTFARRYCYPRHGIGQIFTALSRTKVLFFLFGRDRWRSRAESPCA